MPCRTTASNRPLRHLQHEPLGQSLGQCGDGELLLDAEDGELRKTFRTRDQAKAYKFDYIERFYNPRRFRSAIGYPSPAEFEERALSA
jgi:transposase InsO family protein